MESVITNYQDIKPPTKQIEFKKREKDTLFFSPHFKWKKESQSGRDLPSATAKQKIRRENNDEKLLLTKGGRSRCIQGVLSPTMRPATHRRLLFPSLTIAIYSLYLATAAGATVPPPPSPPPPPPSSLLPYLRRTWMTAAWNRTRKHTKTRYSQNALSSNNGNRHLKLF